jgi:hypothetical protein
MIVTIPIGVLCFLAIAIITGSGTGCFRPTIRGSVWRRYQAVGTLLSATTGHPASDNGGVPKARGLTSTLRAKR